MAKNPKSRKWVFTLNNWNDEEWEHLEQHVKLKSKFFIIGKEVGDSGTPHLQGYIEYASGRYFTTMQNLSPRAHFEKAKGSALENLSYCSKDSNFITNIEEEGPSQAEKLKTMVLESEYKDVQWQDWQERVIELVEGPVHPRKISWFWEPTGATGKSFLCKFLACKYDVILCLGKANDIFNQVRNCIEEQGRIPKIVLVDCPRTSTDFINYGALEQLKNGCLYSGKYEGGQMIFPHPHVVCFANCEPNIHAMSLDRWDIERITDSVPTATPPPGKPGDDEAPPEGDVA